MTGFDNQGALMGNWHKCPNILTDRLVGQVVSPNAGWIILNVWRLTEGMNGRKEALIPTERFMSLLDIKKKATAYKFVQEAVDSGLITVRKQRGMVNVYSINKACPLWAIEYEAGTEIEPSTILGSTDNSTYLVPKKDTRVVPKKGTGVGTKKGTLIKKERNIKESNKETESGKPKKDDSSTKTANSLIDYWNENHGKGANANVKHVVWVDTIKTRLKTFTEDEIRTAMQSVINSNWHQQKNQVLIKNAIDSNKRCGEAISKFNQSATPKVIDRSTDKLAVNNNWGGANKSNIVAANSTIEDMLGDNA